MGFDYCRQCGAAAESIYLSGNGERVITKFSERETGGRLVIRPCTNCAERRRSALDKLERDKSYRAHLARRLAGLECDKWNRCPEHPEGYVYWKPSPGFSMSGYAKLVREAFVRLRRVTMRSISAVEILFTREILRSTDVEYCDNCYWKAIEGFEDNRQVFLCRCCLENRQTYIDRVHQQAVYHEDDGAFLVPLQFVFVDEVLETEVVTPDDFKKKYLEKEHVKFGVEAETIAFGVIGSAGAIASIASAVIAAREIMRRTSRERAENGEIELGRPNAAGPVVQESNRAGTEEIEQPISQAQAPGVPGPQQEQPSTQSSPRNSLRGSIGINTSSATHPQQNRHDQSDTSSYTTAEEYMSTDSRTQ
jgi:hypothetical protein